MLPAQFGVACTAVKIFRLFMSTDCASVHKKMAQGIIVEILVHFLTKQQQQKRVDTCLHSIDICKCSDALARHEYCLIKETREMYKRQ